MEPVVVDKIVEDAIKMANLEMRLKDPVLMQQGADELLERIRMAMLSVAYKSVRVYLEEDIARKLASMEVKA